MNEITLRKVIKMDDLHKVYHLAYDSFLHAGMCNRLPHQMMIHHPDQDVIPETCIFIAEENGRAVGTVSFTLDGYWGLMVDSAFKNYVDRYRDFYGKIASIWRLVVHPDYQNDQRVIRKLIGVSAWCVKKNQVPVCFFTFSPEHARIYEKLFHFEIVCRGSDTNEFLKPEHAEVILMKLYPDKMPDRWFSVSESELVG